jgi:hypothetical protein
VATDETGTATVTFTIPDGATGDARFAITTPVGTASSVVIPIS